MGIIAAHAVAIPPKAAGIGERVVAGGGAKGAARALSGRFDGEDLRPVRRVCGGGTG